MKLYILSFNILSEIENRLQVNDSLYFIEGYLSFIPRKQFKKEIRYNKSEFYSHCKRIMRYLYVQGRKKDEGYNKLKIFELELNLYLLLFIKNYFFLKNIREHDIYIIDDNSLEIRVIKDVLKYQNINFSEIKFQDDSKNISGKLKELITGLIYFLKRLNNIFISTKELIYLETTSHPLMEKVFLHLLKNTKESIVVGNKHKGLFKYIFNPRVFLAPKTKNKEEPKYFIPKLDEEVIEGIDIREVILRYLEGVKINPKLMLKINSYLSPNKMNIKSAVFLFDRYPNQKLLIENFQKHNIPVYMIQHGIYGELEPPIEADYFFIWGDYMEKLLRSYRNEKLQTIKTGNYLYKNYLEKKKEILSAKERFEKMYKIKLDKKVMVFVTQPNDNGFLDNDTYENLIPLLSEMKNYMDDWNLIIKIHPREDEKIYSKILNSLGLSKKVILTRWFNPYELLTFSDRIVFMYSTMGLDGIAFDKEVILINLTQFTDPINFSAYNCFFPVNDANSLKRIFSKEPLNISKEEKERFLIDFMSKIDNNGIEIICNEISKT
ncbi:MAG: hypothetical protein PHV06_05935 [bacterium]|nr:hypothetical protein [bacterium]